MNAKDKLIIALDVDDINKAKLLIEQTRNYCRIYKLGLEFFLRFGMDGVESIKSADVDIFLDLKLHDIPNTVYGATRQVLQLNPTFLTLHASGGKEMLQAAKSALIETQGKTPKTTLLAVTVLTHLSTDNLVELGITGSPSEIALNWLQPIRSESHFGAVCSPQEAAHLRPHFSPNFPLVCPGIRPSFAENNDQTRIATPQQALYSGADYLVVGRPITRAGDPNLAARSVVNEIESVGKTQ